MEDESSADESDYSDGGSDDSGSDFGGDGDETDEGSMTLPSYLQRLINTQVTIGMSLSGKLLQCHYIG